MKHTRTLRIAGVVVGLALLAAACGKDNNKSSSSSDVTKLSIAFVGPLTGSYANLGIYIRDGAKVAVQQFNDEYPKFHITLKQYDTQGDPSQAPGQFAKYAADPSVVGVVGPAFSGETKAVLPSLEEKGLVMVSASATNVDLPTVVPGGKVFHRVLPDDAAQAAGIIKYLTTKLKTKTIAIVHDNSVYGKGLAVDQLSTQMPKDIKIVTTQVIDPAGTSYSQAVDSVKAAKPDVVFFGGYYEASGRLKKQLTDAGVTAQYMSDDGSLDQGFVDAAGAAANGSLLSCPCYFASDAAPGKIGAFAKTYKTINNHVPGTYSTEAFDAANILMTGIEKGNTTRPKLLTYVESLKAVDYAISKKVVFKPDGNIEAQGIFMFKVANGKIVLDTATDDL